MSQATEERAPVAVAGLRRGEGAGNTTGEVVFNPPCSSLTATGNVASAPLPELAPQLAFVLVHGSKAAVEGLAPAVAGLKHSEGAGDATGEAMVGP